MGTPKGTRASELAKAMREEIYHLRRVNDHQKEVSTALLEALRDTLETLDAYGISSFRTKPVSENAHAAIALATPDKDGTG